MPGIPQMPPQAPRAMPTNRPTGGNFNGPVGGMPNTRFDTGASYNQTTGFTEQQKIQRSVARSKKNSGVLKAVKFTRQQLETWLAQFGLKLLTSSIELQMTHNFINSSYVVYPDGSKISLALFLKQTDQNIQSTALAINQQLTGVASQLQIIDPAQHQNPYEQQFFQGFPPYLNQSGFNQEANYPNQVSFYPSPNQMMPPSQSNFQPQAQAQFQPPHHQNNQNPPNQEFYPNQSSPRLL